MSGPAVMGLGEALVLLTSLNDDKKWEEQSEQQRRTVGDRKK